jgi:hypothetical protein
LSLLFVRCAGAASTGRKRASSTYVHTHMHVKASRMPLAWPLPPQKSQIDPFTMGRDVRIRLGGATVCLCISARFLSIT